MKSENLYLGPSNRQDRSYKTPFASRQSWVYSLQCVSR
jgi:hypothetical protein